MADFPLINGNRYSWASIVLTAGDKEYDDITEISYSHSLEPGIVRGSGPWKAGRTRGEYNAEASVTLLRSAWDQLRAGLGKGYLEAEFDVSVSYDEDGEGQVVTDTIVSCRIQSVEHNPSQGTDALTTQLTLNPMYVLENGEEPLKNMRL